MPEIQKPESHPVCACLPHTKLFAAGLVRKGDTVINLKQRRLLHSHYRKNDWSDWLSAVGRPDLTNHKESMAFSSSILTYQAAVDGFGVAIGQIALLDQELEKGVLVCPFDRIVKRPFAYYLLQPEQHSTLGNVRIFRESLLDTIRATPPRRLSQNFAEQQRKIA